MNLKQILFCVCFFCLKVVAQPSNKYWIHSAGGSSIDAGKSIATDFNNNTITTGYFTGSAIFDNTILTSSGIKDIFISKSDTGGHFIWAIKVGGGSVDEGLAVTCDSLNNIYLTGYFSSTAFFGTVSLTSAGLKDAFIVKYDQNGNLQWAKSVGGNLNDQGNGIAVDKAGNVFCTGQFSGTATFGTSQFTSQNDPTTGQPSIDAFIVKLNASGNFMWAKQGKAKYSDKGVDVGCDENNNVYVTGIFSDTIQFDNVYNNNLYQAIFLISYTPSGTERWFRKIGGGSFTSVNGLSVDKNNNVICTGNFKGSLIFFSTSNFTLQNTYSNRSFIAKYDSSGLFTWAKSIGSSNNLEVKDVAVDDSSNIYIIGNFNCKLNEFCDEYGQGVFNTIGYNDIFVARYNDAGTRQWMRQCGSQYEDNAGGIAVNSLFQPVITGAFQKRIMYGRSKHFVNLTWQNTNDIEPPPNYIYCSDSNYHSFAYTYTKGLSDIFISNPFDPERSTYDYYKRTDSIGCSRDFVGVCIGINSYYDYICADDTIEFCENGYLRVCTNTAGYIDNSYDTTGRPGPRFNRLWSNGSTQREIIVNTTGLYWVRLTTIDGCFISYDSIYVIVYPNPPITNLTDNKGVNINNQNPNAIHICSPDSITFSIGNTNGHTVMWSTGDTTNILTRQFFYSPNSYHLYWFYIDLNGCQSYNDVYIYVDTLPPIIPKLHWSSAIDKNYNDTVHVCDGDYVRVFIYDSISDPGGVNSCNPFLSISISNFSFNPFLSQGHPCNSAVDTHPVTSGWYHLNCTFTRSNTCGTLSYTLTDSLYILIEPNPAPSISITGNTFICPGDTLTLAASTSNNYYWDLGPFNGILTDPHQQSILINQAGTYRVSTYDTNSVGCTGSAFSTITITSVPSPGIYSIPANALICPGGSVQLICTTVGTYNWFGPGGTLSQNTSSITVTQPGEYYCLVDSGSCEQPTNSIEVKLYGTPFLVATPSDHICPGESITIEAVVSDGGTIQWLAPLSGTNPTVNVNTGGTYSCVVNSCGIQTTASILISQSSIAATITHNDPVNCVFDSVILFANPGMASYEWLPDHSSDPLLIVYQPGTYSLVTSDIYGCTAASTPLTITFSSLDSLSSIQSNSPLCAGDTLEVIYPISPGISFQWNGPNNFSSTSNQFSIPAVSTNFDGQYSLQLSDGVCTSPLIFTNVEIDSIAQPLSVSSTSPVCPGEEIHLTPSILNADVYQWNGPNSFSSNLNSVLLTNFSVNDTGTYFLEIQLGACKTSNYVNLEIDECVLVVPNVFTPDGNGINDNFIIHDVNLSKATADIFDRWGVKVFSGDILNTGWNGKNHNGNFAPEGTYYYIINITNKSSENIQQTGFIFLKR